MLSIKKILVPIALSPACAWAARYASRLADQFGAKLLFLHVSGNHPADDANAFLADTVGVCHKAVILEGDPAECIVRVAAQNGADLILMPTHAYGRFRRFLLGSVTAKVLHDAECPVWTGVHSEDQPFIVPQSFDSIVCAVDSDQGCVPVISRSRDLVAALGAKLHVVHAVPAADETSTNRGEIEVRHYLFCLAEGAFATLLPAAGLDIQVSIAGGPVERVVREAVLRERAQLVVIGRGHTQGGLGRIRTHSYSIIRSSPCPVLSI
jgi:nucleotide-binding universal stress UspA family protein